MLKHTIFMVTVLLQNTRNVDKCVSKYNKTPDVLLQKKIIHTTGQCIVYSKVRNYRLSVWQAWNKCFNCC